MQEFMLSWNFEYTKAITTSYCGKSRRWLWTKALQLTWPFLGQINVQFFPVHGHTLYACVIVIMALVCVSGCKHSGETTLADQHQPLLWWTTSRWTMQCTQWSFVVDVSFHQICLILSICNYELCSWRFWLAIEFIFFLLVCVPTLYSFCIFQAPKLSKHFLDNANQVVDTISFDTMSVSSFGDEDSDDDTVPLYSAPGEKETGWVMNWWLSTLLSINFHFERKLEII